MKQIEKGMYVRTHCGIKKISSIDEKKAVWKYFYKINDDNEYFALSDNDIVDADFDILNLIKEGDYINGYKVGYIDDAKGALKQFYYAHEDPTIDVGHWIEEIQSILTKEQFKKYQFINKEDV